MVWEIEKVKAERRMELEGRQTAWKEMRTGHGNKTKLAIQIILPLITIMFTISYWAYAFLIYSSG